MAAYQLYFVRTATVLRGKESAAAAWWTDQGKSAYEALPGVRSARAFARQFGLGAEYMLEFWFELENYGAFDRMDEVLLNDRAAQQAVGQSRDLLDWGPSRLVGSWPAA